MVLQVEIYSEDDLSSCDVPAIKDVENLLARRSACPVVNANFSI
jgi:hypothetical protein